MEWYEDDWKFESLEEMAEYCRAYGEEVPDKFYIKINNKIEHFQLCVIGKYKYSKCIRAYESVDCNKYIKFMYKYDGFYYELKGFVYVGEDKKEYDIYSELEDEIDDEKIDEIYEKKEAIKPNITRMK